jgi:predicted  nucleic acid-binding Zn-ribbon protein
MNADQGAGPHRYAQRMDEPDDLEPRVEALEGEVEQLRDRVRRSEQDAAAARVLAGGADRDVADLGGEVREFRAEFRDFKSEMLDFKSEMYDFRSEMLDFKSEMYDFRSEMYDFRTQNNRVLNAMREDMTDLRTHVDRGFAEVRGRLDGAAAGQQQIVRMLDTLIAREDPGTDTGH